MSKKSLRLATIDDYETVYRMVKAHWDHGPYKTAPFSPEKVHQKIMHFLSNQGTEYIVIFGCINDLPVGMIAASVILPEFSDERMAVEHVWWVDPEHRKSRVAFDLIKAYQYWADKKANCRMKHLALFEIPGRERIAKYYQREGFTPTEQTFIKTQV